MVPLPKKLYHNLFCGCRACMQIWMKFNSFESSESLREDLGQVELLISAIFTSRHPSYFSGNFIGSFRLSVAEIMLSLLEHSRACVTRTIGDANLSTPPARFELKNLCFVLNNSNSPQSLLTDTSKTISINRVVIAVNSPCTLEIYKSL